jgi:hypothetical protein
MLTVCRLSVEESPPGLVPDTRRCKPCKVLQKPEEEDREHVAEGTDRADLPTAAIARGE